MMNRAMRGYQGVRGNLPGNENRIDGEERYNTELVFFPEYEFPMTRPEYARIQESRAKAKASRDAANSNIDKEAASIQRPGKFDRRAAEREATKDWVNLSIGSVLYDTPGDDSFTFRMPRAQVQDLLKKPELSSLEPHWNGDSAYIGIHHLDQQNQHDVHTSFQHLRDKLNSSLQTSLNSAEKEWNTQATAANRQIDTAVNEAHNTVNDYETAEFSEVDARNRRAVDDRNTARSSALSLQVGGIQ